MNHKLIPRVEGQYDHLQKSTSRVESEPDLALRIIREIDDVLGVLCCVKNIDLLDAVLEGRFMNLHAT